MERNFQLALFWIFWGSRRFIPSCAYVLLQCTELPCHQAPWARRQWPRVTLLLAWGRQEGWRRENAEPLIVQTSLHWAQQFNNSWPEHKVSHDGEHKRSSLALFILLDLWIQSFRLILSWAHRSKCPLVCVPFSTALSPWLLWLPCHLVLGCGEEFFLYMRLHSNAFAVDMESKQLP